MGIECFRVLFPQAWMPTNTRARRRRQRRFWAICLNKAQWLGKGKPPERLTVEVIPAPVPIAEDPQAEETPAEATTAENRQRKRQRKTRSRHFRRSLSQ